MTHGGLDLPKIFDVAVVMVVHHWMSFAVEDKFYTHEGLRMSVERCMGVFYLDGRMIGSMDLEWLQGAINVIIRLFIKVFLMANVTKSNTMTCHPESIFTGMLEEAFSWRRKVEVHT